MTKPLLEETKGLFKLVGIVDGLENDNAIREGFTSTDKEYKALSFFVKTTESNRVKVEMFGMERDYVIAWNSQEEDRSKARKDVDWEDRHDSHAPFKVMGVGMGLETDSKGKKVQETLVEFDAVDYIVDNLSDGDSVFIQGSIDFQEYEDRQGKVQKSKKYQMSRISKTKNPVEFDDEDFKELSMFEQTAVITEKMVGDDKRLYLDAKIINYKGESVDTQFVVDSEEYPKLAKNMQKRFSFGDQIKLLGKVVNATEYEEVEEEEVDDWGGEKPKGSDNFARNTIKELQVTAVDSTTYEAGKYSEEDFFSEDEENFGDDEFDEEDEFDEDGDDFGDDFGDDDDELPFD